MALDCPLLHQVSHHREIEGDESDELRAAFPQLQAVPGGSAPSWRARTDAPPVARLFRVAVGAGCLGEVTRMRPTSHSLSDSAVFVLDAPSPQPPMDSSVPGWQRLEASRHALPSIVYQWHGYEAPLRAKASALLLANTIRCLDRRGVNSHVHVLGAAEAPQDGAASSADTAASGPSPSARSALEISRYFWQVLKANEAGPPLPPPLPSLPLVLYTLYLEGEAPPHNMAPWSPSSPPLPSSPPQRSTQRSPLASKQAFTARTPITARMPEPEGAKSGLVGAPPPRSPQRPPRQSLAGGPVGWLSNLFKQQSPAHGAGAVPSASASAPAAATASAATCGALRIADHSSALKSDWVAMMCSPYS